jgi:hypothetical protein
LEPGDAEFCPACGRLLTWSRHRLFWVRFAIAAGALCVLVAAGIFFENLTNPRSVFRKISSPADPVYRWVESDARTFDFMPGEGKAWGPVEPQQGEVHYEIKASLPVDTGLMDGKWADRMDGWGAMKTVSSCYEGAIRKSAKVCRMRSGKPQLIFVRDLRAKQAGLGLENTFGTKGALQEPNSVTITILTRKCVENCKYALE